MRYSLDIEKFSSKIRDRNKQILRAQIFYLNPCVLAWGRSPKDLSTTMSNVIDLNFYRKFQVVLVIEDEDLQFFTNGKVYKKTVKKNFRNVRHSYKKDNKK
ncbi:hypothetical protein [Candidatus Hydrogenosomobacter endosymbioticus]|uniref:Uncharacterized protein n=1 Tax=Candidatus Hydrogenosomobacter endosymbioticus TaxID=2558174 RepID=A0ABM7V989_9PROT|nr:hypothetical protein [Candidatus Hydrogenosomobacter endosymbioticus]BDB96372.1 hypothetical protein HYD_5050 [Candidatus Hydrogenosomobacter endosymbioticus]